MDKDKDYSHNQPEEKKEEKLDKMRQKSKEYRGPTEKPLRRSTRLEADRANKRIQQAAKSSWAREKDAFEKWKQRYKKLVTYLFEIQFWSNFNISSFSLAGTKI